MKTHLYYAKRTVLALAISSFVLFGAGCNRSAGNGELSSLMLQTTQVRVPSQSTPTTVTNGNSSSTTMSFGTRVITITDQDKKDFAANLTLGGSVDQSFILKGSKTDIWFSVPNAIIVWWVSNDDNPGALQITKYDGPPTGQAKIISSENYELSAASNTFARNWLASHA